MDDITLRDWFAINSPAPSKEDVEYEMTRDRNFNPHNDTYKPRLRSKKDIECEIRYKWADLMLAARNKEYRYKDI